MDVHKLTTSLGLILEGQIEILRRRVGQGHRWFLFEQSSNLILNTYSRESLRALAGYAPAANYKLARIDLGINGTAESVTDTTLTDPTPCVVTTFSYPTSASVKVEALLGSSDGNGKVFREMGLVMANGVLVSRKTFGAMTKEALWEYLIRWTIRIRPAPTSGVTNVGITHLLKILAGDDAADLAAAKMQFGTGSDSPLPTDVVLQLPVSPVKNIASRTLVGDYQVDLEVYLLHDEANGFPLGEAGILSADDALLARKVFAARLKDSDHQLGFKWSLTPGP